MRLIRFRFPLSFFIALSLFAPSFSFAENALVEGAKIILRRGQGYKLITPAVIPSFLTDSSVYLPQDFYLNKALTAEQTETFLNLISKAIFTPPELSLEDARRNGELMLTLSRPELLRYIDYALPLAPINEVHTQVQQIQAIVDNTDNFFLPLAKSYYFHHFSMSTPHVKALLARVSQQHDPAFEARFLERLEFLVKMKNQVAATFHKKLDSAQIRIRYIHDLDFLTPQNFKPEDLLISVEQGMYPSLKRGLFSHITGETKVRINHKPYRIFNFKGPLEHIEELYQYLVNGKTAVSRMFLTIDHPRRALFLYNSDKSIWLRVTPHEFSSVKKLHLHVHTALPFEFRLNDKFIEDRVLLNLSIPVAPPKKLPAGDVDEILYNLFVRDPARKLRSMPIVTVREKF